MMACVGPAYGDPFVSGLLDYIDCQTQAIASGGYQALASPASFAAPLFTALLTLFVAVIGFRMLMGWTPGIGDVVGSTLKVGIALTLATSWVAYRTVIYDPILKGPAEVGAAIMSPAALPGAGTGFVDRLQAADEAIVRLTDLGAGRLDRTALPKSGEEVTQPPARPPLADDLAFGFARLAFLAGTVGTLGFARLASGVLLALAPIFAGLLLFEATRGLFLGWLRMMIATALGALFVSVILAVELGFLEPWLASAIVQREAFYATPSAPIELLAMTLGFAIILLAATGFGIRLALFATPLAWPRQIAETWVKRSTDIPARTLRPLEPYANDPIQMGRAGLIANAVAEAQRSDGRRIADRAFSGDRGSMPAGSASGLSGTSAGTLPLGQSYRHAGSRVVAPRRGGTR